MSNKKLFSIPSIGEIKEFERKKPEVQSHFKAGNSSSTAGSQDNTSSASSSNKNPSLVQSSSASHATIANNPNSALSIGSKRTLNAGGDAQQPAVKFQRLHGGSNAQGGDARTLSSSKQFQKAVPSSSNIGNERVQPVPGQGTSAQQPVSTSASIGAPGPSATTSGGPSKVVSGVAAANASNSIMVNPRQRGNPILKHVRNVPWQFGDIVPDYVMGRTVCALYLSLRYHHLNPNYIHDRLRKLGHNYELIVLLVQVDVGSDESLISLTQETATKFLHNHDKDHHASWMKDPHHSLKKLARMAILADFTLLLAWSAEEAGRYLETYKAYENKPADALKEKVEQDYLSRLQDCLTTVKSVKKNDVVTLLTTFGTLDKIMDASKEDLSLVPGFGSLKAQRLHNIFHEPFLKTKKTKPDDQEKTGD